MRREVIHAATIAYHIRNAVLVDGSIYAGSMRHFLADKSTLPSAKSAPVHLQKSALSSTPAGTKYFGHWLKDNCLQYLLAEKYSAPLSVRKPLSGHEKQYQQYFNQDWTPTSCAQIDHLIVFQDFAQNSLKARRYQLLTERIRAQLAKFQSTPLVYLKRGDTGASRLIQNESEIIEILAKKGFIVVDISSDSLEYILSSLLNAKIVVSVEGSHISNCWFSPHNSSGLVILQPPDRFTAIHRGWVDCTGSRLGMVVGEITNDGYYFSPSDILRTVDLIQ